uniref:Ankyrin repeat-containing protein At3g12360 family n=2 Tax=Cajanus cajan TaxID=3821 RepID=A0A151RWG6_CAJCA|nr:Ankyrin repeat-containing protein At3g12360 family [Cajanus cajan]
MIPELYKGVEKEKVDEFVDVLEQVCVQRKLALCDVFDQVTRAGDSMLHMAVRLGKEKIVELISRHFPKLLIRRNVRGDTPLHVAVRFKHCGIVKLILSQYGTEKAKHDGMKDITREKNEHGDTPLHEAVNSKDFGVVKVIFDADKDVVHCLNKSKRSPLFLAVVNGNKDILNLLLKIPFPADKRLPQHFGNSPLHAAILERNPDLIEEILKERPELVYLRDEHGGTPLHYAAYVGYDEGFHILLQNSKSDQTALEGNKKGHLPIHLACKKGHIKVVKKFLQHEWPIKLHLLLNQKGQNLLHVAAKNGRSNVVQYLLKNPKINDVTINQTDNDGNTPLHLASMNLFPRVVYFMTGDKRTKVDLLNNKGLRAQDIVRLAGKNQRSIRQFLANLVFKEAGVPLKVNDVLYSHHQPSPKPEMSLKDLLNTFLVVATLMVTVTFAAAFTVPGGVYGSDDPDPEKRGMAVLAHKPFFWVFTTFNVIAMYSSVIACGLMLMAMIFDRKLATRVTILAMLCLVIAFLTVPVAFMAAVRLVVANDSALALLITIIGGLYTFLILLALLSGFFPVGIGLKIPLLRHAGRLVLWILITKLIDYDDKPQKEDKTRMVN